MLRAIAFCLSLLAFAVPANAQQAIPAAPTWDSWLATCKSALTIKVEAIPDLKNHRDRVCALQATVQKRDDCRNKFQRIVEGRESERLLLASMIDAFDKLPKDEAIALARVGTPAYQKLEIETTNLFNSAYALYPKQQASAK